jgi:hypothetical protein
MNQKRYLAAALLVLAGVVLGCGSSGSVAVTGTGPNTSPAGGGALGGSVSQNGDLCGLLGPGDFAAAGIVGAGTPVKTSDGSYDAYCLYGGTSGGSDGIEFDIFIGDPLETYQQIQSTEGYSVDDATADLPGADEAGTNLAGDGGIVAIGVRQGQVCIDISFPGGAGDRDKLVALARLVIQRDTALTS